MSRRLRRLLAAIGETMRLLQERGPDFRADLVQCGQHAIEFRQAACLFRAVSNNEILALIMDSQQMRLRLHPEAKALLRSHRRPLSEIMVESTYLLMIAAVEEEEGVQVHLDSMDRAMACRGRSQ